MTTTTEPRDPRPVLYYAFVGPSVRPPLRGDEHGYTENSGLGGLLFALGFATTIEGLAVHFLLHSWSAGAAWAFTALNLYALVWLVAAYQAARLRPVVVTPDRLLIRTSLLWTVEVPVRAIGAVAPLEAAPRAREEGLLRAAVGVAPNVAVTLTEPVVAVGPFGLQRSVTRIALYVDDPARLLAALALPSAAPPAM